MDLPIRKLKNLTANMVFHIGGISIIFIIILLTTFLLKEFVPLFSKASIESSQEISLTNSKIGFADISEDGRLVLIQQNNSLKLLSTKSKEVLQTWPLEHTPDQIYFENKFLSYYFEGQLIPFRLAFTRDKETGLETSAALTALTHLEMPLEVPDNVAIKKIEETKTIFAASKDNSLYLHYATFEESFLGGLTPDIDIKETFLFDTDIVNIFFNANEELFIGTSNGEVFRLTEDGIKEKAFETNKRITAIDNLFGKQAICIGFEDGSIDIWCQGITDAGMQFFKIHSLPSLPNTVTQFAFNDRDRSFLAKDAEGNVFLLHSTSESKRLELRVNKSAALAFNSKGNYFISYDDQLTVTKINNPHADVNFKTLFQKVWYEGYDRPRFVWQSTGGSQEFESKFSLIPLMIGTFKGALYAMIFALPIALTGAIFLNQFLSPTLHQFIKPVVEVMAGLPSVIIGFLAGLWLAPILEKSLPGILLGCITVPVLTILFGLLLEKFIINGKQETFKKEIFWLLPCILISFAICLNLSSLLENIFFQGNFRQFIFENLNTPYDQRNAVVVGFAMGFAVIPIIFSLTEDAISFVPKEIIAGSLALGLSRWKTATGVVLKAAAPGILSAVMVGFGRAIGETMIVLMATGNTPILSLFPFNGFRTMSANIAVELPEAPIDGSLYRILFLTAFLLFIFTFIINTGTDLLRQHWQRKLKN